MRIWYVVGTVEYWLEPEYSVSKAGRVSFLGARLYNADGQFKGYWRWKDWPITVQRAVRADVMLDLKQKAKVERFQQQALHTLKRKE